jgi:hypothetical protein
MFRLFDVLVFLSSLSPLAFSIYIFVTNGSSSAIYVGIIALFILCVGLYLKLLRIVHFVLYKNLNQSSMGDSNG